MNGQRIVVNGFGYQVAEAGAGSGLVLLHGFTGAGGEWAPFIPPLSTAWRVVAPDLPGHGRSDGGHGAIRTMAQCVDDLTALLDRLAIDKAVVIGYSMGGRTALTWAARHPTRVAALVLESTSPGLASPKERATRGRQDEALAQFIVEEGIYAFVDRWEALPLFASQRHLPEAVRRQIRAGRLAQRPDGLAASLRGMGAGHMEPLHDALPRLTMPALLLAGGLDEKYVAIMQAMHARMPRARLHVVADAGHNVHREQPTQWLAHVQHFLAGLRRADLA